MAYFLPVLMGWVLHSGEICFNTSLTGYQEIISDPSYAGQIINFTFPHIGNVGTNKEDLESDKVWTKGVIFNSEINLISQKIEDRLGT